MNLGKLATRFSLHFLKKKTLETNGTFLQAGCPSWHQTNDVKALRKQQQ